jgi:hypothetical protein
MDVELQILKHLARDAQPTIAFMDEYCAGYQDLFKEVRNYEVYLTSVVLPVVRC